jgi:murein DD-endopeptidase MepM/ murein hydrolase activator NlpD
MKRFKDMVLGIDYVYPLIHGWITDTFRMPSRPNHLGPDLCGKTEDEVLSAFPGKVIGYYNSGNPGGKTVAIMNPDEKTLATYSHLDKVIVTMGQEVSIGQVIGVLAGLPIDKPRPHVHFQLQAWIDAEEVLKMPKRW